MKISFMFFGLMLSGTVLAGDFIPVCERSLPIQRAIMSWTGDFDCHRVSQESLANVLNITIHNNSKKSRVLVKEKTPGSRVQYIGYNEILEFQEGDLSGMPFLESVIITGHEQLKIIPDSLFEGSSNIREIDFSRNAISKIPKKAFSQLEELVKLNLNSNEITMLEDGFFENMKKLEQLTVEYNKLTRLSPQLFQGLSELTVLFLTHNNLAEVPSDLLKDCVRLYSFSISSNQITTLPKGLFDNLENLNLLYLYKNKLGKEGPLDPELFKGLKSLIRLDLNMNQLDSIVMGNFKYLKNLKDLNLSSNLIKTFEVGSFLGLDLLENLHIHENNYDHLLLEVFEDLTRLKTFTYGGTDMGHEANVLFYSAFQMRFPKVYVGHTR